MPLKTHLACKLLSLSLIFASLTACNSPTGEFSTAPVFHHEGMTSTTTDKPHSVAPTDIQAVFLDKKSAVTRLAKKDSYINALSQFDWQSKFKSDDPLTSTELSEYYARAVIDWDAKSQQKVNTALALLQQKIAPLNLNIQPTLPFILTNGLVEAGAAYTREDYIVLPQQMLQEMTQTELNKLVAHEFFHVYSRHNQAHRDKLYGSVHYKKLPPVALPKSIASLVITNPDSPFNEYGIDLTYQGKQTTFVPLLLAVAPYDKTSGESFFAYLRDGLLAVEIQDGRAVPLMNDGISGQDAAGLTDARPLFVHNSSTDFDAVVQPNSSYLNHPEEVSAENFSLWVIDAPLEHPAPVNKLIEAMQGIG